MDGPRVVPHRIRMLQWVGLAVLAVTAFWPTFHFTTHPLGPFGVADGGPGPVDDRFPVAGGREVPAESFRAALSAAAVTENWWEPFWAVRRWYSWFLWPVWALALLLTARSPAGSRRRWLVGAGLLGFSAALVVFEAAYLRQEYVPFLPGTLGRIEVAAAWLVVGVLLLWRRRTDRRVGAVEATIAGQSLLGAAHALTLPTTVARPWWGAHSAGSVLASVWADFPAAFWMGLAALLLVALPTYVRRPRNPSAGRPQVDS